MALTPEALAAPPIDRTMRAAHARQKEHGQGHGIIEASELAEAVVKGNTGLSVGAQKALFLLLRKAGGDAWQDREFSISKAELRGSHNSNDRLAKTLRELRTLQLALAVKERGRLSDWEGSVISITKTDRDDDAGAVVRWRFSEIVREAMRTSKVYAEMLESIILPMESGYSLRLYEIGSLYHRRDHPVWQGSKDELRAMLRVPDGTYRNWADLERKTLVKAKAELDPVAPFITTYETIRRTKLGPVQGVKITFKPKVPHVTDAPPRRKKAA